MNKFIKIFPIILILLPNLAYAQLGGIGNLMGEVEQMVWRLTILLSGIALLVFMWGLVKFIAAQGSETAKTDAKKIMVWGLIALFVLVSVWGIIRFFQIALLGSDTFNPPPAPALYR